MFAGTDVKLGQAGGIFCACDELWKVMLRDTPEAVISRAGCIALFVLAGTFAGRVWGRPIIQTHLNVIKLITVFDLPMLTGNGNSKIPKTMLVIRVRMFSH